MSILSKYIIKNHSSFMFLTLGIGIAIFIIIDLIERADIFFASDGGASYIIPFYIAKLPSILSQILPAVFLLASVILLCVMINSRENIALQTGGISIAIITKLLMFIGIFWGIVQFFCAQLLASYGEELSNKIWREDVRKRIITEKTLEDVWFTENTLIINLGRVTEKGEGENFIAYQFSEDKKHFSNIIYAKNFTAKENSWLLKNVNITQTETFESKNIPLATLPISQSVRYFFIGEQNDPQRLDFFVLTQAIKRLSTAGSNVEDLKTIWHGKLSYAFSIVVFAFLAVAIVTYKENVYVAVIFAVAIAFLTYVFTMLGDSLGRAQVIPPFLAAFAPQVILLSASCLRIQYILNTR